MNCLAELPSNGMAKERLLLLSLLADVASLNKESWVLFILIHFAQGPNHARI